jgi:predicted permease
MPPFRPPEPSASEPSASGPTPAEWTAIVARHGRRSRVALSSDVVAELAAHLEDLYLAARDRGDDDAAARQAALTALARSELTPLRPEPRPDSRATQARLAALTSSAARTGSLAMGYALTIAARQFRLRPLFALLVVLVLGAGMGAATVVYTIVDAVVLQPLPYLAPDRLVKLWDTNREKGLTHDPISPVTFMDHKALPVFADAAAWWRPDVNLTEPGLDPVRVKAIEASGNLFSVLGVAPQLGEGFPAKGPFFSHHVIAVISDRLWRTRYGADPKVIGRQVMLSGQAYEITGVMPPGFHFPDDVDLWQRLQWDLAQHDRHAHFMEAVARLGDGASIEQARAAADTLAARLGRQFSSSNKGWAYSVVPLLNDQLGYYRPALYVLVGAVGLLFVIGCLNVASLLLTRALSREREIAVRTALGASPRQLITQLLAESLLLSAAGAAAGLVFARLALPLAIALTPVDVPRLAEAAINGRVLALAAALVMAMTLAFGLVPAVILVKGQPHRDLKSGERGSSRGTRRIYQGLVVAEVALACALLVGSMLLVRTVGEMTRVPLGVAGDQVILANVQLSMRSTDLAGWTKAAAEHAALLDRIRQQPGIASAGSTNFMPMETGWRNPVTQATNTGGRHQDWPQAQHHSVSEGYFETMGATLLDGRFFTAHDTATSEPVAIVNATFARRWFPGQQAVGQQIVTVSGQIGPLGRNITWEVRSDGSRLAPRVRIVGVIADIQDVALGLPPEPAVYATIRQYPFASVTLAIAARDTATATAALRAALDAVSPSTPIGTVETWAARRDRHTAEPRLLMTTLTAFGAMAALLAALGVYGLFAWTVALRQRELAIRLTLGARPAAVAGDVIRDGAVLAIVGLLAGLAIVQTARGVLATVLFGVTPHDGPSILIAAGLLLGAALAATILPALRAMRVDPVNGLRVE